MSWRSILDNLASQGNLRAIPRGAMPGGITDLSANDYLGLAGRDDLRLGFLESDAARRAGLTSSASRLLASDQRSYTGLEQRLSELYGGKAALLFNSGYHANTGIVSALAAAEPGTVVIADKLVHASVIDGIILSKAPFERFRHNDYAHLGRLLDKHAAAPRVIVIVEGVYSMDGDSADIIALTDLRRSRGDRMMLIVDEAHSIGVEGPAGLGLCAASGRMDDVDIIVGTFGKALASSGAFAVMHPDVRAYLVNKARSLIFSTALPPLCVEWTRFMIDTMLGMDSERAHLREIGRRLRDGLQPLSPGFEIAGSHIQPLVIGDAAATVELSGRLLDDGFKVLPIRTPTVPPSTERLRFSLSASIAAETIDRLISSLNDILNNSNPLTFRPCAAK